MDASTSFRKNLRKLRLARRFTQEDLATDANTSTSFVSDIENGKALPTIDTMERLAKALGVSVAYLLRARIAISVLSEDEIEVGALTAKPAKKLTRQPGKALGRPRKKI